MRIEVGVKVERKERSFLCRERGVEKALKVVPYLLWYGQSYLGLPFRLQDEMSHRGVLDFCLVDPVGDAACKCLHDPTTSQFLDLDVLDDCVAFKDTQPFNVRKEYRAVCKSCPSLIQESRELLRLDRVTVQCVANVGISESPGETDGGFPLMFDVMVNVYSVFQR